MNPYRHCIRLAVVVVWTCVLAPSGTRAADLYLQGHLSVSAGVGDTGGSVQFPPAPPIPFVGDDTDSSPLFSGAFGYEFPLNEIFPPDWETPLPAWPLRVELEGLGGRDYEFVTQGGDRYLTDVESWSLLNNFWLDLPVHDPISRFFGRIPLLEPMSFYLGGGVGFSYTELSTSNNALSGGDDSYHLTWQVGSGFGYRLTEYVSVNFGYRYVDMGDFDYPMVNPPADTVGRFSMDLSAHEFTSGLRVNFFSVKSPGSWSFRRGR